MSRCGMLEENEACCFSDRVAFLSFWCKMEILVSCLLCLGQCENNGLFPSLDVVNYNLDLGS